MRADLFLLPVRSVFQKKLNRDTGRGAERMHLFAKRQVFFTGSVACKLAEEIRWKIERVEKRVADKPINNVRKVHETIAVIAMRIVFF